MTMKQSKLCEKPSLSYPRTCVLGNVQPSLRDWSCSEPQPSTACWAKFSRPFGTGFRCFLGLSLVPYGLSIAAVREINLDKTAPKQAPHGAVGRLVHWLVDLGVEARVGIEPTHKGFADLSLTAWVPRHLAQL
jgi:hypothetical protein